MLASPGAKRRSGMLWLWRKQVNSPVIAPVHPPASRVSRWLMPWRMIRGEENYASRFIESMCQKEPQLKNGATAVARLLSNVENEE